jgi:colanic acid/amylovoran biosynthesis glycosyltransferase
MVHQKPLRVGFVVKRYPRYSETFIVREILAHERAGVTIDIFSLRPPNDSHFQDLIARVRGSVSYLVQPSERILSESLSSETMTTSQFWKTLTEGARLLPALWDEVAEAGAGDARYIYQAIQLACEIRLRGIDHLHAPFGSEPATVARLAARFAGVPFSMTLRAKDIFHESADAEDLKRKLRDAATVVTISDYHMAFLRETFGPSVRHLHRVYNGLDLEEFPYRSPANRPRCILAIGRLVEKKGFGDLIEACAILKKRGVDFTCRIVGHGVLREELIAHINRLDLASRVEIVGPRPQTEVIEEIQMAAVLAAPCIVAPDGDRDGLPNVIQEALALGTPVVSTDVTGIPEVVRDQETGIQVPQRDPLALAAALERLLDDRELRVRLASQARAFMEREFDIHKTTARRRALFHATVESPNARELAGAV